LQLFPNLRISRKDPQRLAFKFPKNDLLYFHEIPKQTDEKNANKRSKSRENHI